MLGEGAQRPLEVELGARIVRFERERVEECVPRSGEISLGKRGDAEVVPGEGCDRGIVRVKAGREIRPCGILLQALARAGQAEAKEHERIRGPRPRQRLELVESHALHRELGSGVRVRRSVGEVRRSRLGGGYEPEQQEAREGRDPGT